MSILEDATQQFYCQPHQTRSYDHPVVQAFSRPKLNWIQNHLKLHGKKVLEVGGGNGYFSSILDPCCHLTVLDISQIDLDKNPAKTKVCGSAYDLPFADHSFDVVFCSNLLHHLDDPLKALEEMARVSKKNVVISEPNVFNPIIFFAALLVPRERGAVNFSKSYLSRLLVSSGLKITAHTFQGGLVMPGVTPQSLLPIAAPKTLSPLSFFQIFICQKTNSQKN